MMAANDSTPVFGSDNLEPLVSNDSCSTVGTVIYGGVHNIGDSHVDRLVLVVVVRLLLLLLLLHNMVTLVFTRKVFGWFGDVRWQDIRADTVRVVRLVLLLLHDLVASPVQWASAPARYLLACLRHADEAVCSSDAYTV